MSWKRNRTLFDHYSEQYVIYSILSRKIISFTDNKECRSPLTANVERGDLHFERFYCLRRLFLHLILQICEGIAEVEGDIQRAVFVDDDAVDQLRQERAGEALDIAVLFEMLDEFVGHGGIGLGMSVRFLQLPDAPGQVLLHQFVLLLIDAILVGVDDAFFEVGIQVRKQVHNLVKLFSLLFQLSLQQAVRLRGTGLPHFPQHLISIHRGVHHLLDAVQHAKVQALVPDGVRGAGGLALTMRRTAVINVGLIRIAIGLFDQRVTAVGAFEQSREQVDIAALYCALDARLQHFLHAVKVLSTDDRRMGILDPDPFVGRAGADGLAFVIDLLRLPLHHRADVHFILEGSAHGLVAPQT